MVGDVAAEECAIEPGMVTCTGDLRDAVTSLSSSTPCGDVGEYIAVEICPKETLPRDSSCSNAMADAGEIDRGGIVLGCCDNGLYGFIGEEGGGVAITLFVDNDNGDGRRVG